MSVNSSVSYSSSKLAMIQLLINLRINSGIFLMKYNTTIKIKKL